MHSGQRTQNKKVAVHGVLAFICCVICAGVGASRNTHCVLWSGSHHCTLQVLHLILLGLTSYSSGLQLTAERPVGYYCTRSSFAESPELSTVQNSLFKAGAGWNVVLHVIWFHFTISPLVLLPIPVALSVFFLFFFFWGGGAYWPIHLTCFSSIKRWAFW